MKITSTIIAGLSALALSAPAQAEGVTDDSITFGTYTALSGPAAVWGVNAVRGINLRFAQVNEAGGIHGRMLNLIAEDTQYQVPLAVKAANKLIARDKVFALLGPLGTPHVLATKDRAMSQGVPVLFPYTAARAVMEHEAMKITAGSTYYDQTRQMVRYLHEKNGRSKVCVMYQDTDFGTEILDGAKDEAEALGLEVVATAGHKPTATEFVGAMTNFKSAGCDLIAFGTIIRDTIIGYGTARKLGIDADIAVTIAGVDTIVSAVEGGVTQGLYGFTGLKVFYPDTAPDSASVFYEGFKEMHGDYPPLAGALAYLYADLVVQALEAAGPDLTAESLVKGFEQVQGYTDIWGVGPYTFGPGQHNATDEVYVVQVQDGRWVNLD